MKILKVIFGALLCLAAYAGYWYFHAHEIEKAIKAEIADCSDVATITYDSMEKRGFPFSIQVALINPKVQVVNEAISFALEGNLLGRWSVLGKLQDIDLTGKSRFELPVVDDGVVNTFHFEGNAVAEVDSIKTVADKGTLRITDGTMHCTQEVADVGVKFDLITLSYDVKHPTPDRALIDLLVDFKGGKTLVKSVGEVIEPIDFYNALAGAVAEKSGKDNATFTLKFDLPSMSAFRQIKANPMILYNEPFPAISVNLEGFSSSNELAQTSMKGLFTINEDEHRNVNIHVDVDYLMHFLAQYHEALVGGIDAVAKIASKWDAPSDLLFIKNVLVNHSDSLKDLVPHPENFGKIQSNQGLLFVVNKNTFNWHSVLEDLSLSCDKFGIFIKGAAQTRTNILQADATINLKNAPAFIEELVGFYNRIEKVVNLFEQNLQMRLKPLPVDAKDTLVAYLRLLSTDHTKSADELEILVKLQDGKIYVGSVTLEEATAEFEAIWASIMAQIKPPATSATPSQEPTVQPDSIQ